METVPVQKISEGLRLDYGRLNTSYNELLGLYRQQLTAFRNDTIEKANALVDEKNRVIADINKINDRIEENKQRLIACLGISYFKLDDLRGKVDSEFISALLNDTDNIKNVLKELTELDRKVMSLYTEKLSDTDTKILSLKTHKGVLNAYKQSGYSFQGGYVDIKE
jgi:vacuolar-type H+-ATPase subunit I/STV1